MTTIKLLLLLLFYGCTLPIRGNLEWDAPGENDVTIIIKEDEFKKLIAEKVNDNCRCPNR